MRLGKVLQLNLICVLFSGHLANEDYDLPFFFFYVVCYITVTIATISSLFEFMFLWTSDLVKYLWQRDMTVFTELRRPPSATRLHKTPQY